MFPVRHVAAGFCSKGACEVIATTPHSAAHTGGADFLGTVEPHWARFALSGVLPRSAPMSALCVCVLCASPAALACPLQDDITATSPGLVPAAAQGGRRTRPMALAEPAAGERCRMASSSPTCLPLLAGTLPALLSLAGMLPAWPQNQWPAADSVSRINSFDVRPGIAGCRRGVCRHSISLRLSGGYLSGVFAAGCPSSSKLRRLV